MKYNLNKVQKILSEIIGALENLKDLQQLNKKEFISNSHMLGSCKYYFIVTIEGIIDLCNHLIAQNRYRTPKDYADTFQVLFEQGLFDEQFTNTLKKMARFRNRLIHLYWEVDKEELYQILQTHLGDVELFLEKFRSIII